jgi:hypothetical protein
MGMMENIVNTQFINVMVPFNNIMNILTQNGWQFITTDSNKIVMNKKYHELEEINIEYKNSFYHFSLPINNSSFSYYKKIADEHQAIRFFEIHIGDLIQLS